MRMCECLSQLQVPVSVLLIEVFDCFIFRLIDIGYFLTERFLEYHEDGRLAEQRLLVRDQLTEKADIRTNLWSVNKTKGAEKKTVLHLNCELKCDI